jgi:YidC/Oxa1 family membrane protein insertase
MNDDQKNLFLAMGLSLIVIMGWNYFYSGPQVNQARETQAQVDKSPAQDVARGDKTTAPALPAGSSPTAASETVTEAAPTVALTREAAIASSPRIAIDTPSIKGSINLRGGRLDDVELKDYRETTDPKSPLITLLSPTSAPTPFLVNTGFILPRGAAVTTLPGPETLWKSDGHVLSVETPVTLTYDNGKGLIFQRIFSVDRKYMFTITDKVSNNGDSPVSLSNYARVVRIGKPKTSGYAVLHEGFVGVVGDSRVQEITYDAIEKETKATRILHGDGAWLGFTDKYWAVTVIPDQSKQIEATFSSAGEQTKTYQTIALDDPVSLDPHASTEVSTRVFVGAKENSTIDHYQLDEHIHNFDLVIDWGWFYFITKPLFRLLDLIFNYVGNFGIAILIVTVLIKGAFFPLANRSYLSMAKMKAVQPQLSAIKDRFPDDRQKQQEEIMALYKRERINPVAGCLPILIQIPVFFALYKVIFITIEMRHAPFFGWIKDLSAPDPTNIFTLFGLIPLDPTQLPLIGHFLVLGIWPIIMGFTMFLQMKMNPEPTDPVQQQMFAWMPVIFTFMLGSFPSGLVIYWTWNNTLSVTQQYLIMRRAGVQIELWNNLRKMIKGKSQ